MVDRPDWLRANYRDAQGKPRRICVGMSEQALRDHAQKHGKQIEQTHAMTRTRKRRMGNVVKRMNVTVIYGLLSA